MNGERSIERLAHFRCGACAREWSIGDPPGFRSLWWCPWCGVQQHVRLAPEPLERGATGAGPGRRGS